MKEKIIYLFLGIFITLILILFLNASGITQGKYQGGLIQGAVFIIDTDTGIMKGYDFPAKTLIKFDYNTEEIEMVKKPLKN